MSMRYKTPIWKVKRSLEQYYSLTSLVEHLSPTSKLSIVFGLMSGFRQLGSSLEHTTAHSLRLLISSEQNWQRSWLNSHMNPAFHRSILLNLLKDQDRYSCTATYLWTTQTDRDIRCSVRLLDTILAEIGETFGFGETPIEFVQIETGQCALTFLE